MSFTNWAGNVTFAARDLLRPTSLDELARLVAASDEIRPLGTGHSFNRIADTTGDLVTVADLPKLIEIDAANSTVRVSAGLRYGELTTIINDAGFALPNLGSLPHISVAGACATGTHGSGNRNAILATSVSSVQIVTADGAVIELDRSDPEFGGSVLALGSLGFVTAVTLDLVPSFEITQYVYEDLPHEQLYANFDEITAAAYSFSMFTNWRGDSIDHIWLKSATPREPGDFFGARAATVARHPIIDVDPAFATVQLGEPGPWHTRLPHFKLEFTPSNGDEIQSEYFVDREHAVEAFRILNGLGELMAPVLLVAEVRAIAADDLWISPMRGRDRIALHFSWIGDHDAVEPVLRELERQLDALDPVPHWGKLFFTPPERLAEFHPRLGEFADHVRKYDPSGKFANDFTRTYVLGA